MWVAGMQEVVCGLPVREAIFCCSEEPEALSSSFVRALRQRPG
jgi:hypothetical protein